MESINYANKFSALIIDLICLRGHDAYNLISPSHLDHVVPLNSDLNVHENHKPRSIIALHIVIIGLLVIRDPAVIYSSEHSKNRNR